MGIIRMEPYLCENKKGAIALCDTKHHGQPFMNFMLHFMPQTTSLLRSLTGQLKAE